jgi:hypothetical protein
VAIYKIFRKLGILGARSKRGEARSKRKEKRGERGNLKMR